MFWIIGAVYAVSALAVVYIARNPPKGYQDDTGFHYGDEQDAVDLAELTRSPDLSDATTYMFTSGDPDFLKDSGDRRYFVYVDNGVDVTDGQG